MARNHNGAYQTSVRSATLKFSIKIWIVHIIAMDQLC